MKKFILIATLIVLVVSAFSIASSATDAYWSVSPDCHVEIKALEDGKVPSYKKVEVEPGVYKELIVGLPSKATIGDKYFNPKGEYTIGYVDAKGNVISGDSTHIGTTDSVIVYSGSQVVAEYGLVTYGDADGDGVYDVIDAAIASLCQKDFLNVSENAAVYEAVKLLDDGNDLLVEDYQILVNNAVSDNSKDFDKGRKTPINDTLNFESVIYENTGAQRIADVTAVDSRFTNFEIRYNGSGEVPTDSGVYSVTAVVPENDEYIVTTGERALGFIVIAPKSGSGYKVTADNTNKKITVSITNAYASDLTLDADIKNWYKDSIYSLVINGATIADGDSAVSAMPNRAFDKYYTEAVPYDNNTPNDASDDYNRIYQRYASLENSLGQYLPDDETLWDNSEASNSRSVSLSNGTNFDYTLVFKQDTATIDEIKFNFLKSQSEGGRGQRSASNTSAFVYAKEKNGYPAVRVAVKTPDAKCKDALGATGLKTLLVGHADAMAIEPSTTTDFSSSDRTLLYTTSNDNRRVSNYKETLEIALYCLTTINNVLNQMDMPSVGYSTKLSKYTGSSGYCNYICVSTASGLRYNSVYYLEFMDYDAAEDSHYTLTIGSNVTMVTPAASTKYDPYSRMAGNEPVKATAPAGYKLVLQDANGNEIPMNEKGYFLMPYSNATITAVEE